MAGNIEHRGIVCEERGNGIYQVHFSSHAACSSCNARSICGPEQGGDNYMDIPSSPGTFKKGEEVKIIMRQSAGYKALMLGYVFPFLLIFTALVVFTSFLSELLSGLLALSLLIPYFIFLYLNRNKMKHTFRFTIEKLQR